MRWASIIAVAMGSLVLTHCMRDGENSKRPPKSETIVMPAGTQSPVLGLAFDLSYDPSTNDIIPGYHMLTVGITNNAIRIVQLSPVADQWLVVDRRGRKYNAVLNLRQADPDVWSALPQRLKALIEYPLLIGIGETRAIDLLFPDRINLADFQQVVFKSAGLGKVVSIYARETTQ